MVQSLGEIFGQPAELARHDYREVFQTACERLRRLTGREPREWQVIELGAGYTYPNTLLFPTVGAGIVGVDVLDTFARDGLWALYRARRRSGRSPRKALLSALRFRLKAALYHRALAACAGRRLDHRKARLITYDGQHLPLADETFDVAISNAVLEHVVDLDAFAREVARVLRPGGVVDMLWHNFYSFSGDHLPPAANTAHPWGHLTGEITQFTESLNKARPEDIEAAFRRYLKVERIAGADEHHHIQGQDREFAFEAESLLTPQLAQRLQQYPRDLLLTRAFLIQARKA